MNTHGKICAEITDEPQKNKNIMEDKSKSIDLNLMEDLLSRKQVGKKLGVCSETVKRYEKQGILPAYKMNSKNTKYDPKDVEKLLQERRIG